MSESLKALKIFAELPIALKQQNSFTILAPEQKQFDEFSNFGEQNKLDKIFSRLESPHATAESEPGGDHAPNQHQPKRTNLQSRQQPKTFETVQVHRGAGAERGDVALILGDDLAAKR